MTTIDHPTTAPGSVHAQPGNPGHRRLLAPTAGLVAALVVGLLAGVATSYLQGVLPGDWNQAVNSGAVWTVVAFAVAAACTRQRWVAVACGGLALLAEVAGYYLIASPVRGIATTPSEQLLWSVAALWIGPAAGFAAWCCQRGAPAYRLVAALALAGLVGGEGGYETHRLGHAVFGRTELGVGLAVALVGVVCSRAGWGARVLALGAFGLAAVSTYAVYAQTILM